MDLKFEQQSARRFAREVVDAKNHDELALYQFSRDVDEVVPFTANIGRIDRGIASLHPESSTSLYDAIYLGAQALNKRQGRKVMVLITDGGDTGSSVGYQEALRAAQQSEALLYSVIIVPIPASAGRDLGGEHALVQLARDTGAQAFYADSMQQLDQAFGQISAELRNQYLLAYYPVKRLADSDFRRIEVQLSPRAADFNVRYRTGYYTSKLE
jgi:Ca-activated chloride channel family protein